MNREMLYNDLSGFLAMHFPCKVQKISINAGFTCPNRDGSVGYGGCTYCNNQTFNPAYCIRESLLLSSWKKESGSLYANIRK